MKPFRQCAERVTPVATQTRRRERFGHVRVAVANQQRAVEHDRDALHKAASAGLGAGAVGELFLQLIDRLIQARIWPKGLFYLAHECTHRLRLAIHRTEDVEGVHVARALPDRIERRLAIQAGPYSFLHAAAASPAFERPPPPGGPAPAGAVPPPRRGDAPVRRPPRDAPP